jgi:hypothetical protein
MAISTPGNARLFKTTMQGVNERKGKSKKSSFLKKKKKKVKK